MNSIKAAWTYIEAWLDREAKYHDSSVLAKGASFTDLDAFQQEFKIQWPPDLRESYLLHDGFAEAIGLFYGGDLLPIAAMKSYYRNSEAGDSWPPEFFPVIKFNEYDFFCIYMSEQEMYNLYIDHETGAISTTKLAFGTFSNLLITLANDLRLGNGPMGELLC